MSPHGKDRGIRGTDDESENEELEQIADEEQQRRRRKINNFLMLARNAQNAHDEREREEQRRLDQERQAWDETLAAIRESGGGFEFDR